jgi:hypothetical protein
MFGSHTLDDEGDPPAPDSTMFGVRPEDEASSRENPAVVTGNRIVAVGENANQASRRWSAAFGDSEGASARTVQLPGLPGLGPSPSQPASSKTMLGGVAFGFDDLESGDAQPAAAQPAPRRQMPEAAARFGSETQLTFGNSGIDRGAQTLPPGAVSGDTIVPSLAAHGAVDSGATLAPGSAPGVSSRTIVGSFAAGGFDAPVVPRVEPATPPVSARLDQVLGGAVAPRVEPPATPPVSARLDQALGAAVASRVEPPATPRAAARLDSAPQPAIVPDSEASDSVSDERPAPAVFTLAKKPAVSVRPAAGDVPAFGILKRPKQRGGLGEPVTEPAAPSAPEPAVVAESPDLPVSTPVAQVALVARVSPVAAAPASTPLSGFRAVERRPVRPVAESDSHATLDLDDLELVDPVQRARSAEHIALASTLAAVSTQHLAAPVLDDDDKSDARMPLFSLDEGRAVPAADAEAPTPPPVSRSPHMSLRDSGILEFPEFPPPRVDAQDQPEPSGLPLATVATPAAGIQATVQDLEAAATPPVSGSRTTRILWIAVAVAVVLVAALAAALFMRGA